MGLDIGPETIELYKSVLNDAKIVFWNGPMGVFEDTRFANGTKSICAHIASLKDTFSVIGGGDSASAVINMGLANKMTHISTGGGASLKLFEGKILPGVDVIDNKGC